MGSLANIHGNHILVGFGANVGSIPREFKMRTIEELPTAERPDHGKHSE